jgi:vesicle coat complex subunit
MNMLLLLTVYCVLFALSCIVKQVFILDSLAKYTPVDGREAEGIIERVTPRLQHANSAVVMSAVKASATSTN